MKHLMFFIALGTTSLFAADPYGQYPAQRGGHYDQSGRYHCAGCNGSDAFYEDLSSHPGTYEGDRSIQNTQGNLNQIPNRQGLRIQIQQPYSQADQNLENYNLNPQARREAFLNSRGAFVQTNPNSPYGNPNQGYLQGNPQSPYAGQGYLQNNPQSPYANQGYLQGGQRSSFSDRSNRSFETARSTQPTDRDIESEIRDDLSPGWFSKGFENVTFQVLNGNVTLRGTVETNDDKDDIESSVKDIDGVKQVNNQIIVTGRKSSRLNSHNPYIANEPSIGTKTTLSQSQTNQYPQDFGATDADRTINKRIRDRLKSGWFSKGYDALIIKTSNGIVTIIGSVDEDRDVPKVTDEVKKVEGVKKVNSQITVNKRK